MEVPSEFICPITMELMVHPLVSRYGQNFERAAIIAWLEQGSGECPLTRQPLKMSDLIHNNSLAAKIRTWRHVHETTTDSKDSKDGGASCWRDELTSVDGNDDDSFDIAEHIYGTGEFPFTAVMGPQSSLSPPHTITIASSPRSVRSLFTLRSPLLSPSRRRLRLRRLPAAPALEATAL